MPQNITFEIDGLSSKSVACSFFSSGQVNFDLSTKAKVKVYGQRKHIAVMVGVTSSEGFLLAFLLHFMYFELLAKNSGRC